MEEVRFLAEMSGALPPLAHMLRCSTLTIWGSADLNTELKEILEVIDLRSSKLNVKLRKNLNQGTLKGAHTAIVTKRSGEAAKKGCHDTGPSGSSVLVRWFGIPLCWNGNN
jgi:hypothetical protein